MRSRPKMQVLLRPGVAAIGSDLVVEVVLTSGSETPVSSIDLTLRGHEHAAIGGGDSVLRVSRPIVAQRSSFGARTLTKGEHRLRSKFVIPAGSPPSHRGRLYFVEYELDVHVVIPWWLDRRETYRVTVGPRPREAGSTTPQIFSSGASGEGPYIELSLDDVRIETGGVLSGAVSFSNLRKNAPSNVEIAFIAFDAVRTSDAAPYAWSEASSLSSRVLDRPPKESETVPFRIRLPKDATPSFASVHGAVAWKIGVVASGNVRDKRFLEAPIEIVAPLRGGTRARKLTRVPPVGRERRELVWRAAAQKLELDVDTAREEMRGSFGVVSMSLRLEQRDSGLFAACELEWPSFELSLTLRDKKWTDAFANDLLLGDTVFDKRFLVAAADAELARTFLDEELRKKLVGFREAVVEDDGALFAHPVSVQSTDTLLRDLGPALDAARCFERAVARMPLPATAGPYR